MLVLGFFCFVLSLSLLNIGYRPFKECHICRRHQQRAFFFFFKSNNCFKRSSFCWNLCEKVISDWLVAGKQLEVLSFSKLRKNTDLSFPETCFSGSELYQSDFSFGLIRIMIGYWSCQSYKGGGICVLADKTQASCY